MMLKLYAWEKKFLYFCIVDFYIFPNRDVFPYTSIALNILWSLKAVLWSDNSSPRLAQAIHRIAVVGFAVGPMA